MANNSLEKYRITDIETPGEPILSSSQGISFLRERFPGEESKYF